MSPRPSTSMWGAGGESSGAVRAPAAAASSGPVDPESLFESQNVDEITAFARSLTRDADKKREELRTMVGERYRDLMEAADTIAKMRDGADQVVDTLDELIAGSSGGAGWTREDAFVDLDDDLDHAGAELSSPYLEVAAEVKLLTMAPELMWAAVERGDVLTASRLFLFARYIHVGLSLEDVTTDEDEDEEAGTASAAKIASMRFPVVARQWASIAQFQEAINRAAGEKIAALGRDREVTTAAAVEASAALLLLSGASVERALADILGMRTAALHEQLAEDARQETAKTLIANASCVIMSTTELLRSAFADGGLLKAVLAPTPVINLFEARHSLVFKRLPAFVRDFTPAPTSPPGKADAQCLEKATAAWLDAAHEPVSKAAAFALAHVNNVEALSSLKKSYRDFLLHPPAPICHVQPEQWAQLSSTLLGGKEINMWEEYFKGPFRDRIEAIVTDRVAEVTNGVAASMEAGQFSAELDLTDIWSDAHLSEVEQSVEGNGEDKRPKWGNGATASALELRSFGYSPRVLDVCRRVEAMLSSLLEDLHLFVQSSSEAWTTASTGLGVEDAISGHRRSPFDDSADCEALLAFAQDSLTDQLARMIDDLAANVDASADRGLLLFVGRLCQAMPRACYSLESAVLAQKTLSASSKAAADAAILEALQQRRSAVAKADPRWTQSKDLLENCSSLAFKRWTNLLTADLAHSLATALEDRPETLVRILPAWQVSKAAIHYFL